MNILVIDDKRDNLISLKAIINDKFQYAKLYMASDGPEGIKIAIREDPDVILLDIVMPGMDGFEVCSVLKNDYKTKDIPVVFITALKGDKQSRIKSLEVGGEAFLSKPIDESELIAQVNAMARIKKSRNDKKLEAVKLEKLVKEKTKEIEKELLMRKNAQKKLSASEEQLRLSMKAAKAGSWSWNLITDEVVWDDRMQEIFGLKPGTFEGTFESWRRIVHPDDVKWAEQKTLEAAKKGTEYNFEYRLKIKEGDNFWRTVNAKAIVLSNDKDERIKMVGFCIDVTEQKKVQESLRKSEERYNLAMEASTDGIFDWDLVTNEIYYSPGWKSMLGYTDDELPNDFSIWENLTEPEDVQKSWKLQQELINKQRERFQLEFKMKHKDGHWVDILSRAEAVYDNDDKAIRIVGTHVDISGRKLAQLKLKEATEKALENEEKYRLLHENAGLGIGYYKTDGTVISFNSIASKDMNGVPEDFAGKSIFDIFPKEYADFYFGRLQKAARYDEIEVYEDLVELPTEKKWVLSTYTRIVNSKSEVLGIQIISQNITKIKQSEEELKSAKEKAEESDRLKSAFLANMSHEIRTPMNGILGFISLLNDPNLNSEQTNKYSEIIKRSGKRLLDTINDIIDISKIEVGEIKVTQEETSLSSILDEVYSFHLPEATKKGLSLSYKTNPPNDQTIVLTDNHKLVGILSNLIKNAVKYTEKGSISFGYKLKSGIIEFFVEDTGIGIPKNRIQAIFNRFEQADIEDKKAFEGSGLGLAIAKAYVEMLGGKIDVESEDTKGSVFTFTIPNNEIMEKEIEEIPLPVWNDNSRIKELNLLIAEDEDVSSELLLAYLKDIFNNIIIVKNGKEAIEACKQNPSIDMVLMDLKMPIIDGYTATSEIRKFNKELIIIAQTAYALPGDDELAKSVGCNDYITKPIDKNRLIEVINIHLN